MEQTFDMCCVLKAHAAYVPFSVFTSSGHCEHILFLAGQEHAGRKIRYMYTDTCRSPGVCATTTLEVRIAQHVASLIITSMLHL